MVTGCTWRAERLGCWPGPRLNCDVDLCRSLLAASTLALPGPGPASPVRCVAAAASRTSRAIRAPARSTTLVPADRELPSWSAPVRCVLPADPLMPWSLQCWGMYPLSIDSTCTAQSYVVSKTTEEVVCPLHQVTCRIIASDHSPYKQSFNNKLRPV